MATPPHVFSPLLVLRLLTVSVTGRRLLQPHIKSHSRFVLPLFQNQAECDVRLIVKFWNLARAIIGQCPIMALELGNCIFSRLGIHAVVAFWYLGVTS